MKFYAKSVLSVLAIVALLGYSGCGPDPAPEESVSDQQLAKLSATWNLTGTNANVTLDGVSKKTDYNGFTLTISGTPGSSSFGYACASRPALSPWPASGTWAFGSDPATMITRDSGAKALPISYVVTANTLELTFTYNGAGESRNSVVTGKWVFTLTK